MKPTLVPILLLSVGVSFSHAFPNVFNFEIPKLRQGSKSTKSRFSDLVNQVITKYHFSQLFKSQQTDSMINLLLDPKKLTQKVNGFSWKDCGGTAGKVTKLELSPDPIQFPGTITVSAGITLNTTLDAPLELNVLMEKSDDAGHWITIPCIQNFGSCNYTDICELMATISQCPDPLIAAGIPCQCPLNEGTYNLNDADFEVDVAFLPAGTYHVKVNGHYKGKQAFCLDMTLSISY